MRLLTLSRRVIGEFCKTIGHQSMKDNAVAAPIKKRQVGVLVLHPENGQSLHS